MKTLELMNKKNLKKFVAVGLALAGLGLAPGARAQTELLIGGGNATQALLYEIVSNLFTISSYKSTSSSPPIRTYIGTIPGYSGLGTVTLDFALLGGVQGLTDLAEQNTETTAYGSNVVPALVVSSASPTASAVNPNVLTTVATTLAVPYAYVINPTESPNLLANVTNLTERQANFLEGAAGFFPSGVLGGGVTNDTVYLVPRNTASAVRTEIDANIYFTETISAWTTNGTPGQPPIPDPNGGQSSGSAVRSLLALIPESIGTVAFSDISTETTLNFEGVKPTIANVENGTYPLWYYEQWFTATSPQTALTANQQKLVSLLLTSYTNSSFQATNSNFAGYYVPLTGLTNFYRSSDGGAIQSSIY